MAGCHERCDDGCFVLSRSVLATVTKKGVSARTPTEHQPQCKNTLHSGHLLLRRRGTSDCFCSLFFRCWRLVFLVLVLHRLFRADIEFRIVDYKVTAIYGPGRSVYSSFSTKCAAIHDRNINCPLDNDISDPEDYKARKGNHRQTGQRSARVK